MSLHWHVGSERVAIGCDAPAVLMGIVNVTPDSFSDGGLHADVNAAVDAAMRMVSEGAQMIDVGGESTRPGAQRVSASEQIRRVVPVIEQLRAQWTDRPLISVDTTQSAVARAAIEAGACVINDVAAGQEDVGMFELAAKTGCGLVLMHRRSQPQDDSYSDRYSKEPEYVDVVSQVREFLLERCEVAMAAGVKREQIVIDPGLGFGKSVDQNFEIVRRMGELVATGFGVLCAASRKSFIGKVSGVTQPRDRVAGSLAVAVAVHAAGARLFRVHDVAAHREALTVAAHARQSMRMTDE